MNCKENKFSGIVFDNYDRFVDILSGKGTLHDTVGIFHKDVLPNSNCSNTDGEENVDAVPNEPSKTEGKRRRKFDQPDKYIEPYRKKSKCVTYITNKSQDEMQDHISITAEFLEKCFILSHAVLQEELPMWEG